MIAMKLCFYFYLGMLKNYDSLVGNFSFHIFSNVFKAFIRALDKLLHLYKFNIYPIEQDAIPLTILGQYP